MKFALRWPEHVALKAAYGVEMPVVSATERAVVVKDHRNNEREAS